MVHTNHELVPGNTSKIHPNCLDVCQELTANWAGNIANNYGYTQVWGNWAAPCLNLHQTSSSSFHWIGLGGDSYDGGGPLVQAGTASNEVHDAFGFFFQQSFAWIQDYPNDPNAVIAFYITCGDSMSASIWQDYNNRIPYKAHMDINDETLNAYWSAYNTEAFANGSTAEWIRERPGIPPVPLLADFGQVTFSKCYAVWGGNSTALGFLHHNYALMYKGNDELAYPTAISSDGTSFTNHFKAES